MSLKEMQTLINAGLDKVTEATSLMQQAETMAEEALGTFRRTTQGTQNPEALQANEMYHHARTAIGQLAVQLASLPEKTYAYLQSVGLATPTLTDAAHDTSRSQDISDAYSPRTTEQEALKETADFLDTYIANGEDDELKQEAQSIKDSLNFIGTQELNTACKKIGDDWAEYLASDSNRQILVVPGISAQKGRAKSDTLVTEKILERVHEKGNDIENLNTRIVGSPEKVTADLDDTRVIVVDDWTLSGKQLSVTAKQFAAENEELISKMEVNLIVASPNHLKNGFSPLVDSEEPDDNDYAFPRPLPVIAPLVARPRAAPETDEKFPSDIHVTGTHSEGDFGFAVPIDMMQEELEERDTPISVDTPLLAQHTSRAYANRTFPLTERLFENS